MIDWHFNIITQTLQLAENVTNHVLFSPKTMYAKCIVSHFGLSKRCIKEHLKVMYAI